MEIGEHYALPLVKKKMIYKRYVIKIWYYDSFGRLIYDHMSKLNIKNDTIRATVYKIHKDYVEFSLQNNKVISLKNEQAYQLEKFL